jgi:hypothetical protein
MVYKEESFNLACGFNSWLDKPLTLYLGHDSMYVMMGMHDLANLITSWQPGSNERKRQEGARVPIFPLRRCTQSLTFFH